MGDNRIGTSETGKHTPGPFRIGMVTDGNGLQSCNEAFVTVGSPEGQDEDDCEIIIKGAHVHEVARLIAAAPDMLAVLKEWAEDWNESMADLPPEPGSLHADMLAAIAKATGTP